MSSSTNLYDVLEVHPRARSSVIHEAFKVLVKEYEREDTDRDDAIVKNLQVAFETLGDPVKRRVYDASREHLSGVRVGDYRVLEEIAEGGFGKTYRGEHLRVGKSVCIKHCSKISPQYEKILTEETEAMWDLRHFAIPAIRDLLKLTDGSLALVMSYIPGLTLEQIVQKTGPLDPEHVAWITERILNALTYIHYHGVIHGDLKPQNIIVQETHEVAIVDFGLSMVKPKKGQDSKGYTHIFAPPEEIAGKTLLPESDFYSLGKTILYMLTGNLLHVEDSRVPAHTPEPLCVFIRSLILPEIEERPQDARDLWESFRKVRKESFGRSRSGMKPIPGF